MTITTTDLPPLGNQSEPEGQVGALLTLSYVVRSIQNDLNDYSMQQYKRLMQITIEGLGFLRIFHAGAIQVAYLQCNSAGIVPFPKDYIRYSKIGIYCHGRVVTLTMNNTMALNRAQVCAEDIRVMEGQGGGSIIDGWTDGYYFAPHYVGDQYVGGLYGAGGGINIAYYKIDEVAKQIQFNGFIPNDKRMVLEYQSTGISAGTIISRDELDPLKKYVHQYRVEYDDRVPLSTKERRGDQFDKSVIQLRASKGYFTMSEYMDTLYRAHKQSPKPS